jgi:hypothetical protein
LVYDLNGQLITWRDGLNLGITNPSTRQMYLWNRIFYLGVFHLSWKSGISLVK